LRDSYNHLRYLLPSTIIGILASILFVYMWYSIWNELWDSYPNIILNTRIIFRVSFILLGGLYIIIRIGLPSFRAIFSGLQAIRINEHGISLYRGRFIPEEALSMKIVENLFFIGVRFYEYGKYRGYVYSPMLKEKDVRRPSYLQEWVEFEMSRFARQKNSPSP